jgi:hypothetical protein
MAMGTKLAREGDLELHGATETCAREGPIRVRGIAHGLILLQKALRT